MRVVASRERIAVGPGSGLCHRMVDCDCGGIHPARRAASGLLVGFCASCRGYAPRTARATLAGNIVHLRRLFWIEEAVTPCSNSLMSPILSALAAPTTRRGLRWARLVLRSLGVVHCRRSQVW